MRLGSPMGPGGMGQGSARSHPKRTGQNQKIPQTFSPTYVLLVGCLGLSKTEALTNGIGSATSEWPQGLVYWLSPIWALQAKKLTEREGPPDSKRKGPPVSER